MIESIQLDPHLCLDLGLKPDRLDRLGKLVAITGPNGAGKTRLLRLLTEQWQNLSRVMERTFATTPNARRRRMKESEEHDAAGEFLNAYFHYLEQGLNDTTEPIEDISKIGNLIKRTRSKELEQFQGTLRLSADSEKAIHSSGWPKMIRIINAPRQSRYESEEANLKNLQPPSSMGRLNNAARHLYMSHHSLWKKDHEAELISSKAFLSTVSALLDVDCNWAIYHIQNQEHVVPTLDGRAVVSEDELSEGQRIILRWCEIIHQEVDDLRQAIILLDEPELHLHPELLIRTFDRLRDLQPPQIFIATHSLSLLAHIGVRHIHEMRKNKLTWAGNRVQEALHGLVGSGGTDRLYAFLGDAATIAFHQFTAECLLQPDVVPLREKDPQAAQFSNHLSQMLKNGDELHVLDYAAGSGRLAEAIASLDPTQRGNLQYHAFCDPEYTTPDQRQSCRKQLARLHDDVTPYFHEDIRERQRTDATKMHGVILSNVLHEIPSEAWPRLMEDIDRCLRPDGWLLILEDQRMNVGELPHERGFLVLDHTELKALFAVTDDEPDKLQFAARDRRLSMAQISQELLGRCAPHTVRESIELLRKRALRQIRTIRRSSTTSTDHRRGREHAYYAMLHTNATLALEHGG